MTPFRFALCLIPILSVNTGLQADGPDSKFSPAQQSAIEWVDANQELLCDVNHQVWEFAEVGLAEYKSAKLIADTLEKAGFEVERGVADMPTAFVASYGSGSPVIGILAEYDALPELSQQTVGYREPREAGRPGHACGHSALGSGALGAVLAVKDNMEKHDLKGTIHLYGCPAEETVIGKVYMTLDGVFDDLDVCLHWHPSDTTSANGGSSKALVSAKFSFEGIPSHGSVSPHSGRSALDAVELMNIGANFMREHIEEDARLHYVITNGGGQPNVVPPTATVWYFVRADRHADVEQNFAWLQDIAKGAALMTQTKMSMVIDTDCHEIIPNTPLTEAIQRNLELVGPPRFDDKDRELAARLQSSIEVPGTAFGSPLQEDVKPLSQTIGKGSTDVGDISWKVPTAGLRVASFCDGSPGHSWQNVASIGSGIGEKGLLVAAKTLGCTAIELFENPDLIEAAKADFAQRTKGVKYTTLIPEGQKAPAAIR